MIIRFDLDFIDRTLKTTGIVLLIAFFFGTYYYGLYNALAFLSGGVWGIVNLMLLKKLVRSAIRPEGIDTVAVIMIMLVKFPLLYAAGYFLLKVTMFTPVALVVGFSSVLGVLVLKALGRVFLGLDTNGNNKPVEKVI